MQQKREQHLSQKSLGIKSFHVSANSVPTLLHHGHRRWKRAMECIGNGKIPSVEDLRHGDSAQEFLAQCLFSCVQESKRLEDQPQQ